MLEVNDRAGERAGYALDALDLRHDQLSEVIDGASLRADDHIVGPGHVFGGRDALDLPDFLGDLSGAADLGLDKDVRVDHSPHLLLRA